MSNLPIALDQFHGGELTTSGGRPQFYRAGGSTGVVTEWQPFVQSQVRLQGGDITRPKLICIDLQSNATTQAPEESEILNVGGFSDAVFDVISSFVTATPVVRREN